jgi:hypothetical protein
MIGSKALSCSCPPSTAMDTVTSAPATEYATWDTASGMTGLTLPGMIDDPGLAGGQIDLTDAGLRPRGQQAQVVRDLRHLQRAALERTGEGDEDARVGGRFDEVAGRFQVELR